MTMAILGVMAVLAGVVVALGRWRSAADARHAQAVAATLKSRAEPNPQCFDPAMTSGLPEIAQRYFAFTIAPGTPLHRVATLTMSGDFLLNGRALPMSAEQVLAPPDGLVWQARIGAGVLRLAGSDGYRAGDDSWTRFWLHGLVPLARSGGNADHTRAAAARMALETVWCPAALLPQFGAVWRQVTPSVAEIEFPAIAGIEPVRLTIEPDGRPVELIILRWSDANPDRRYRLQTFGGRILAHAEHQGFRVPAQVEIGNGYGRSDFQPFFRARITNLHFGPD